MNQNSKLEQVNKSSVYISNHLTIPIITKETFNLSLSLKKKV